MLTSTTEQAKRVRAGIDAIAASANLRGKPVILVHGRSDEVEPPNFTSRPYVAANSLQEKSQSQLKYIEVVHGVHGEGAMSTPGFDVITAPVTVYQLRALEAMFAHLMNGTALPSSQVVRPQTRTGSAGSANPTEADQLPQIVQAPQANSIIEVKNGAITVPK
jgi:hydroxybutyrate-dimer hydrolase